jgi:hypothetical protein
MENVVIKPLGKVLEQAGLISDFQVRTALEIQSQSNQIKFGTILVTQGLLKQKTVDFFADRLPELLQQPKIKPLGYYLQEAALIDSQQIETLLEEQKQTGMRLGELAVEKGWLREKTLNFFLQHLEQTEKKLKLLPPSYQEIIKSLHLETKAASPYSLLKEVFSWTGGHPLLTRQLCQIISNSKFFISPGMESILVEKLVQDRVINNWETQAIGEYLKTIQDYLLNNTVCLPRTLLQLYLQVLQQGEVSTNQSREKEELINLGLIIEQENKLKVSNRIYQSIFNSDWVKKQLLIIAKKSQPKSDKARKITPNAKQILTATQIKNEPLTQIAAWIIVLGLLLILPTVIFLNNSQHKLSKENDRIGSQSLSMSTLCVDQIPAEEATQEDWRIRLEQEQQQLQEQFPDNCQRNLDKLIVLNALQLGKKHRVLDGINNLCKISATSESFNQAKFWLNRWHNSAEWGEHTQSYLQSLTDCPAAKKLASKF